ASARSIQCVGDRLAGCAQRRLVPDQLVGGEGDGPAALPLYRATWSALLTREVHRGLRAPHPLDFERPAIGGRGDIDNLDNRPSNSLALPMRNAGMMPEPRKVAQQLSQLCERRVIRSE